MGQVLLLVVVALTVAAVVFGVTVLVTGGDPGLGTAEPDGRAVPLPGTRPLIESDVSAIRFDTTVRGYRMAQVDQALRRAAYDIGYKDELIGVLEAEVIALREGRKTDAEVLRRAREAALVPTGAPGAVTGAPLGAASSAPAGVVDLGDVSPEGPAEDAPEGDATEGPAEDATGGPAEDTAEGPADVSAEGLGEVSKDGREAEDVEDVEDHEDDDEVDSDTDPVAQDAEADTEPDDGAEPEDGADTAAGPDVRAALPDRDERA